MGDQVEEIDDSLYSRQRYMLGDTAMKKMARSNILLVGCGPVGVEIAKNLVLAGIKTLTVADSTVATKDDIGTNFYITKKDVADELSRSEACVKKLAELNPHVKVAASKCDACICQNGYNLDELLSSYHCIVLTERSLDTQIKVDNFCRSQSPPIKFIAVDVFGVFSSLFCDFGDEFEVFDVDGEEPKEVLVANITQASPGVVTCMEFRRHGLSSGDKVTFIEVRGMDELNGTTHTIKYVSPDEFSISDTSSFGKYISGGICTQVKTSSTAHFASLESQLTSPSLTTPDLGKLESPFIVHCALLALHQYVKENKQLPKPWDADDAETLLKRTNEILEKQNSEFANSPIATKLVKLLSYCCRGNLHPLSAAIGGICAQEVLTAITGKYTPLQQWLHLDASELLEGLDLTKEHCSTDRYNSLSACIGTNAVNSLKHLRVFLVGCGAIGCEMVKNLSMLGVSADGGKVTLTDNDIIEKSNLNRQFLFRSQHIQKPKSEVAASMILKINDELLIESLQHKICPETEKEVFNDQFFQAQDVVINALDNVDARKYVDSRCVRNQRPLVESGTMGAKGHVQIIVPHVTESYESQSDPADHEVPYCTLKSFPQNIEHTIQWARVKFESLFNKKPSSFNTMWSQAKDEVKNDSITKMTEHIITKINDLQRVDGIQYTVKTLSSLPTTWSDCVIIARHKFEKYFNHRAKHLLHAFPLDSKTNDGRDFWISPKRPPHPIVFDEKEPMHLLFIVSTASLYANIHDVKIPQQNHVEWRSGIDQGLSAPVPAWVPTNKKIETDEDASKDEKTQQTSISSDQTQHESSSLKNLLDQGKIIKTCLNVEDFEKDDDTNHHIDFITATSNLRAAVYAIQPADRLKTKKIAGRIVPAIATTTSAVAGLATIQFLQVVMQQGREFNKVEAYRNCFLNLGLPMVLFSEPAQAPKTKINDELSFTLWDIWEVRGNDKFTLNDFLQYYKEKYNLIVSMVFFGARMVYVPAIPTHLKRLPQLMSNLVKTSEEYADLIIAFENSLGVDEDDLSCPPIRYYFK